MKIIAGALAILPSKYICGDKPKDGMEMVTMKVR